MQKVTAYKAKDGTLFEEEHEAREYDAELDMEEAIHDSDFYHGGGLRGITDSDDLAKFLGDNKDLIFAFMGWSEGDTNG